MTTEPSTATKPQRATARRGAQPAASQPATKRRRSTALIAGGMVMVIVGGLASYFLFTDITDSDTVVTTATNVSRGDIIEATDLGTIEITGGQSAATLNVADIDSLIGQVAATDLPKGSLLNAESVGNSTNVPVDQSIVGIALAGGQLPSTPLVAGDTVRIVATPLPQSDVAGIEPATIAATVYAVGHDERSGSTIVNVQVPANQAALVAAHAATGRVALVLDAGGAA